MEAGQGPNWGCSAKGKKGAHYPKSATQNVGIIAAGVIFGPSQ
jgi:hypothetical protein